MSISKFYTDITEKNFKFLTISSCFLADLAAALYIYLLVNDKSYFEKYIDTVQEAMRQSNTDFKMAVDPNFLNQLWGVVLMTTLSMIMIFMVIHAIVYFFYFKDKKFAKSYVTFYTWTVAILYTFTGVKNITNPLGFITISGLFSLYIALGFNQKKKAE